MSNQGEVFTGGACTSQHVDAHDDDHFQNTTFKLKRTRSLGLLDEFIDPDTQEKQIEKKNEEKRQGKQDAEAIPDSNVASTQKPELVSNTAVAPDSASPEVVSSPLDSNSPFLKSPDIVPHDDSNLAPEPSRHVDYLSHQWDVSDISKSWRYIILRRKNVANAARLENASWRTWAQRRCNLKTISPEEVNWSKESDVTWLYGPIVDDDDHDHDHENDHDDSVSNSLLGSRSFNTASSVVAGDISIARKAHRPPKPILKKRTMEDMMISHLNLLKLEVATARAEQESRRREDAAAQARRDAAQSSEKPPEYFDYDVISAKLNSQYKNYSQSNSRASSANNSSVDLVQKHQTAISADAVSAALLSIAANAQKSNASQEQESKQTPLTQINPVPKTRHVRFNDEVQQCIAIDETSDYEDGYDDYDTSDYDYDGSESYFYDDGTGAGIERDNYDGDLDNGPNDEDEEEEDDEEDEGGFFLNVRSSSKPENPFPGLASKKTPDPSNNEIEDEDDDEVSSVLSLRTIHMLPPTTLNYGSSNEESDDYTSSISHNIDNSSSRGYDYYYDYNTVYEVNPNHAIYGSNSRDRTPDVVDVPENISLGSNFDYEIIENEDVTNYGTGFPEVYGHDHHKIEVSRPSEHKGDVAADRSERIPISCLDDSVHSKSTSGSFSCNAFHSESESESDNEGGLSISARNSSQSLAQQAFGQPLTEISPASQHFPDLYQEIHEPQPKHISTINPRYSSTSLSKQPHSSGSLADQFFGGTMTLTEAKSNSNLGDMFLNYNSQKETTESKAESTSSPSQFSLQNSHNTQNIHTNVQNPHGSLSASVAQNSYSGTASPPIQRKSSPLPPTTTAANIFLGSRTPTPKPQQQKSLFMFDSEDDSEPEFVEDNSFNSNVTGDGTASSYASLYKVAGRTGISRPTPDTDEAKKGLAVSNFLGGWNKNSHGS
ncbi:hypothetical protein PUMCH_002013 [Australozyma saopauloensis]|uniref:Nitrogen regulatory protein areA GATA-like domain-containing protein n=1 Tax=Australozyma saopauloensis TaxID=291208 RepID=A0AAX4H8Z5_9ASCO|nr:hypothetical protein PUMCH_002013 [[Candida] saopauloensis]